MEEERKKPSNTYFSNSKYYYSANFYSPDSILTSNGITYYQFADVFCKNEEVPSSHEQTCNEITIVYGGKGIFAVNGVEEEIGDGQIHFCFSNDYHIIKSVPNHSLQFFCIGFNINDNFQLLDIFNKVKHLIKTNKSHIIDDVYNLHEKCKILLSEFYFDNNTELSKNLIKTILNELILLTLKMFLNMSNSYTVQINDHLILATNISNFIKRNIYSKNLSQNLSDTLNYSYSHMSHIFSKIMGITIKDYIASLRMEKAKSLLQSGDTVTMVSNKLNYSSVHAFSRAYKKHFGSLPSGHKKN